MARIRTIKPEFYRHEKLQELESSNPQQRPMLVYAGLFCQSDKNGVFLWDKKQLALEILPFVWKGSIGEALGKSLELLSEYGFISRVDAGEKSYGVIHSFKDHQRINGKESTNPARYAEIYDFWLENKQGSIGEASGKQSRRQELGTRNLELGTRNGDKTLVTSDAVTFDPVPLFKTFWNRYPRRNGKKLYKAKALAGWKRIVSSDKKFVEVLRALENYTTSLNGDWPVDAFRWLAGGTWKEWITPDIVEEKGNGKDRGYSLKKLTVEGLQILRETGGEIPGTDCTLAEVEAELARRECG